MTLPFNRIIDVPTWKDVLDAWQDHTLSVINCHALATVSAVFPPNTPPDNPFPRPVIQATINYSKTVIDQKGNAKPVNYPVLSHVPVVFLCGGGTTLSFPIAIGDQALIIFNDRAIDNWLNGSESGQLNSLRLHSFSDGIALVGLNKMTSWDTARVLLTNGTVQLGINPGANKVTITNGTSLLTILQGLIDGILGLTTPSGPVTDTTMKVAGARSALAGLLEA